MERLWNLIEALTHSINECACALTVVRDRYIPEPHENKKDDLKPVEDVLQHIVEVERDNLKALLTLYDSLEKEKPATNTTEFALKAIADYRESLKKIK